ncbi:DUF5034 domain-containing protein [Bacteroides sp. 519]|uniref:DUF5034 domain-containing protein n=1 Tax=Bacteroides sp. 519 TaxID=2302937 RepID=UPI0013D1ECEF|nr:DUF5034 domain-containing protein [Bacteroides sp. 519]NDV56584.1 DUF5034 domain-containing protein [Bacteroides sp. 519]
MKEKTIQFLALMVILLLQACGSDDHNGTDHIIQGNVKGILLQPLNNGGLTPAVSETYPKEAFVLAIKLTTDSEAWVGYGRTAVDLPDPITAIRVYSVNNFNDSYPAGSDISSLFKQYPLYINNNLDDTLERGKHIERIDYLDGFFYKALLMQPTAGAHQFKVEIQLKSGKLFTAETEELIFV